MWETNQHREQVFFFFFFNRQWSIVYVFAIYCLIAGNSFSMHSRIFLLSFLTGFLFHAIIAALLVNEMQHLKKKEKKKKKEIPKRNFLGRRHLFHLWNIIYANECWNFFSNFEKKKIFFWWNRFHIWITENNWNNKGYVQLFRYIISTFLLAIIYFNVPKWENI